MLSSVYHWLLNWLSQKLQAAVLAVLSAGPIPRHVAFIMDGNRRYARRHQKPISQGHFAGYQSLQRTLEICLRLRVPCVSVYAFAIENFKRSQEEVDALMDLFEEKFIELSQHGDLLDQYGVRLNVIGKTGLLPVRVQRAIRKAEDLTKHNSTSVLNFCMPYGSQDEITTAVQCVIDKTISEKRNVDDISEEDINAYLMTTLSGSPPLDMLVRTSGVRRLSDFMTWQSCEDTQLHFTSTYWPEFGLWDFLPMILDYQHKVWSKALSKHATVDVNP